MYIGKNDGECHVTGVQIDEDRAYDEEQARLTAQDQAAISKIIQDHIFSAKDLVDALVEHSRRVRRGLD